MCNRYYCYFCLKGSYDTLAENIKDNNEWLCPYCTGTCYCTRCMRNEKILQLIAYYFSIKCKSSLTEKKYSQRPFKSFVVNGTTIIRSKYIFILIKFYYRT
jgi:hypothetical protein